MKVLFIHQNFPAQFKHLAAAVAKSPANQVVFITKRKEASIKGVRKLVYRPSRESSPSTHRYLRGLENAVLHGQAVARLCLTLERQGFVPDLVIAHPGWGEALFVKDVFPNAPLLNYFEFFYHAEGADAGFEDKVTMESRARLRTRNALHLLNLEACDWGMSPTRWQWSQHPAPYRGKISIVHDGIDTQAVKPVISRRLTLPNGQRLSREDEVVTFVSRNLEPYRGFHKFMYAVEQICRRRPRAQFLIVGGDDVSYGRRLPEGRSYRKQLLSEVSVDRERVHFLGRLPYRKFLSVLQVSSTHVYLTYPFVLSWSLLEAMAAGCLIIGSATPPVEEVIEDGTNGLLVDFFSPAEIADRVDQVLAHPTRMAHIRQAARETVLARYDLRGHCLPRQLRLIQDLVVGRIPPSGAKSSEQSSARLERIVAKH